MIFNHEAHEAHEEHEDVFTFVRRRRNDVNALPMVSLSNDALRAVLPRCLRALSVLRGLIKLKSGMS